MIYIYMDESGDLGFGKGSSNVFVISYIATNDSTPLKKKLKKLRKRKLGKTMKELPEFKFYNSTDKVKDIMFNAIDELDLTLGYVVVNKNKINPELRTKKRILYNYLIRQLLDDAITLYDHETNITLILDRLYSNRSLRDSMDQYLSNMATRITESNLKIKHESSQKAAGLQFADFICGAVWRFYSKRDSTYIKRLKFTTEKKLFFKIGRP